MSVGDYLLAVNGVPVDTSKDPWAAFRGLAGRTVTLTVSDDPTWDDDARDVVVELLGDEGPLRYRAWVEKNPPTFQSKRTTVWATSTCRTLASRVRTSSCGSTTVNSRRRR